MNIISIDYGIKYIGLSLGNLKTFNIKNFVIFKNSKYFYIFLKKNIFIFFPKLILIGFPCFFKINSLSYINFIFYIKKFFFKIINNYNIKIKLINEFFSSFNFFKKTDDLSAHFFMREYFNSKAVGFEPTIFKNIPDFKSDAINLSAIPSI